jgi:septal ring factor EnvC (AmiA/AmiB activator)
VVSEQWRKRFRIGGQVLLYILIAGYLLVILVDLNSLRSNISSMSGDISSLQSDVSSIQSDVSSIQSDVSSIQNDVSAIADDLDDSSTDSNTDPGKSVSNRHRIRPYTARLTSWHPPRNHEVSQRIPRRSSAHAPASRLRNLTKAK